MTAIHELKYASEKCRFQVGCVLDAKRISTSFSS
jgi:hypothetical protein